MGLSKSLFLNASIKSTIAFSIVKLVLKPSSFEFFEDMWYDRLSILFIFSTSTLKFIFLKQALLMCLLNSFQNQHCKFHQKLTLVFS